jgi:hypothetical protein
VKELCFSKIRFGHTWAVFGEGCFHCREKQTSSARDIASFAGVWVAEYEISTHPSFGVFCSNFHSGRL